MLGWLLWLMVVAHELRSWPCSNPSAKRRLNSSRPNRSIKALHVMRHKPGVLPGVAFDEVLVSEVVFLAHRLDQRIESVHPGAVRELGRAYFVAGSKTLR